VDEVSMVDVPLMASLIRALPPQAGLLLVGTRTNCLRWVQELVLNFDGRLINYDFGETR
jgi:ATP-dependent exoDNAse (exonuclease V) alpha subunit